MSDRFHTAAKTGSLDVLSEATRKDCNKPDDDGMTPTLWAAVKGNVDTLRVIVSRGGDPEKCDFQGNTCLHWAAAGGHLNAITFLVSFDCNIWAMNNNHQTPMDVAAEKNRRKCIDFLDDVSSKKSAANPRLVKRMKLDAMTEADKRVKKYFRMQKKLQEKIEKEESKEIVGGGKNTKPSTFSKKARKQQSNETFSSTTGKTSGTIRSQRDSLPLQDDTLPSPPPDFEPPNTLLMVSDQSAVNAIMSIPAGEGARVATDDDDILNGIDVFNFETGGKTIEHEIDPKLGPRGYRDNSPWDVDLDDLDDDDGEDASNSLLEIFLAANGLHDYLMIFMDEAIDLDALTLLIDDDLSKLGIPMGPRRKLLQAVAKRRMVMEFPGAMVDSDL